MFDKYRTIIVHSVGISLSEDQLSDEQELEKDLFMDDVDFAGMVAAIETVYGFSFDNDHLELRAFQTVRDVKEYIRKKAKRSQR